MWPWGHPIVVLSVAVGAILWIWFLRVEKAAEAPIVPLKMLWSRPRSFLVFSNFTSMVASNAVNPSHDSPLPGTDN